MPYGIVLVLVAYWILGSFFESCSVKASSSLAPSGTARDGTITVHRPSKDWVIAARDRGCPGIHFGICRSILLSCAAHLNGFNHVLKS